MPQIKNVKTIRERPAITTHNPGNNSVTSKRWRYIQYANGEEKLYDHENDPHEHSNLAGSNKYLEIKEEHAKWLKNQDAPHAPGSVHRKLKKVGGHWYWEENKIIESELIK